MPVSIEVKPWDLPDRIVVRVIPEEIITELRTRVNKGYMPSANSRVEYNSKPEYVRNGIEKILDSDNEGDFCIGSGYYANDTGLAPYPADTGIYAVLHLGDMTVVCQLKTDKLWIRIDGIGEPWHVWTNQSVPINRILLSEVLETYL